MYIYIYIQFRQIPMRAVAVQQYRPAVDSCMNGMRPYRIGALAAPDSSDPEEYRRLAYSNFLTVIRMLNVDLKYRKCESKYEKVII